MDELVSQRDCTCLCHKKLGVTHAVACCDGLPLGFWDEYDDVIDHNAQPRSKPRGRSSNYEEPSEWMAFIQSKRTGKPLRGPGSESMVD